MEYEIQNKSNDENSNIKNEEINQDEVTTTETEEYLYMLEKYLKEESNTDKTILVASINTLIERLLCDILKVPKDPNKYYSLDNIYGQKSDYKFNKIRKKKELSDLAVHRELIDFCRRDYSIDTLRVMLRKYERDNNISELITRIKQMAINISG